jgi:hypothetical protein
MDATENGYPTRQQRFEERFVRNKNTAITWAAVLLWGALSLLLDTIPAVNDSVLDGGTIFVLGAGAILLLSGMAILFGCEPKRGVMFRLILGFIFLAIGIGEFTALNENIVVAGILVLISGLILTNAFKRRS